MGSICTIKTENPLVIVDDLNASFFEILYRQRNRETTAGDIDRCELQFLAQTNQRPRAMWGQVDQEKKIVQQIYISIYIYIQIEIDSIYHQEL